MGQVRAAAKRFLKPRPAAAKAAPAKSRKVSAPAEVRTREEALEVLRRNGAPADLAGLYADAWAEWREAVENIGAHGSIVAHPRTGAPIENPYLRVRDRAFERLLKLRRKVNADGLWRG